MKVWVLLPAFNETTNMPPLLEAIAAALEGAGMAYGVVVVDDGSVDGTGAVAEGYAGRLPVQVVTHGHNRGLARAVETGIRALLPQALGEDIVVMMDADNTHPPVLIPRMISEITRGADVVIASRYAPGGMEEGVPALRRLLSYGLGVLMRVRFGLSGVRDYSSGYRAYRAALLHAAAGRYGTRLIESEGFIVMAELLLKLHALGARMVEVPLHLRYDLKQGGSKIRLGRTVAGYLRLLISRLAAPRLGGGRHPAWP